MKKVIISFYIVFSIFYFIKAQTNWIKHPSNPVFTDTTGGWTIAGAYGPFVLFIDSTYHMWYMGTDLTYDQIGYATSQDGITWTAYENNPVLRVGAPGSWEATSVVDPYVVFDGSLFHMWYSGVNLNHDLKEAIGYATSPDGINWSKYSDQPVLQKGSSGRWDDLEVFLGSVIFDGSLYHMWFSGAKIGNGSIRETGYAYSSDGANWTKDTSNNPVLSPGSSNFWDYPRAAQPKVVYDGVKYHMFYSGSYYLQWRIGYATSINKTVWSKYSDHPVLDVGEAGEWDEYYVGVPAVIIDTVDSVLRMWYTGGHNSSSAHIGYAYSQIIPPTAIDDGISKIFPERQSLFQNYPNPFNSSTTITYQLSEPSWVKLEIYSISGQKIKVLVSKKQMAGSYKVQWDGSKYASGVYLYKLKTNNQQIQTRKLILLK